MKRFKHIMSLILVLLMCMAMDVPAFAMVDTGLENVENLTPVPLDETLIDVLPEEEILPAVPEGSDEDASFAAEIRNMVSIRSVTVYPVVKSVETGERYRILAVKRSQYWAGSTQSDDLTLKPAATTAFINETITWLSKQSDTAQYTWEVVGWNVNAKVELAAQNPLRVEYKPHDIHAGVAFETITKDVSSQYSTLTLSYTFNLPPKSDEHYYQGFEGAFYFRYPSGKEGGLMFGCGVIMNSKI